MQNLKLSTEWDKTFPKSEKVNHRKITFHNRYGITLVADMYIPVKSADKLAPIFLQKKFVRTTAAYIQR